MHEDNDPGIPDFLKRQDDKKPVKREEPKMVRVSESAAPEAATEVVDNSTPPPAPTKVKAPKKAKAPKEVKASSPEKAEKPKKVVKAVQRDKYGFREGSLKSRAASLYASKQGATLAEVKAATGSVQLNLLKELEGKNHTVQRVKEEGKGGREVTRYFLS